MAEGGEMQWNGRVIRTSDKWTVRGKDQDGKGQSRRGKGRETRGGGRGAEGAGGGGVRVEHY